jgi:hypothetical protein
MADNRKYFDVSPHEKLWGTGSKTSGTVNVCKQLRSPVYPRQRVPEPISTRCRSCRGIEPQSSSQSWVMEVLSSSETSVTIYQTSRRNIPGDNHLKTTQITWKQCVNLLCAWRPVKYSAAVLAAPHGLSAARSLLRSPRFLVLAAQPPNILTVQDTVWLFLMIVTAEVLWQIQRGWMVRRIGLHSSVVLSIETPNWHRTLLFHSATRYLFHNPQQRLPEAASRDANHRNQNNNLNLNRRLHSRGNDITLCSL